MDEPVEIIKRHKIFSGLFVEQYFIWMLTLWRRVFFYNILYYLKGLGKSHKPHFFLTFLVIFFLKFTNANIM